MSATNAPSGQRSPTLADRMELWILQLSKLQRRAFAKSKAQYQDFYEEYFEDKDVEAYTADPRMTVRRRTINETLAKYLPAGSNLLDVGCGLGDVLAGIDGNYKFFGFDFAASNVERAKKRLGDKAVIKQGSIYEIPYDTASMDGAMCTEVLEHIEDDHKAIRDIGRVVKQGGIFITSVPYQYYYPDYEKLMGHFRHYTRDSFDALLAEGGFKAEVYLPNYPNWHRRYLFRYVLVRAQHILFRKFVGSPTLYQFKYPWSSKPKLQRVAEKLEGARQQDATLDYSKLDTSTFVLARKIK